MLTTFATFVTLTSILLYNVLAGKRFAVSSKKLLLLTFSFFIVTTALDLVVTGPHTVFTDSVIQRFHNPFYFLGSLFMAGMIWNFPTIISFFIFLFRKRQEPWILIVLLTLLEGALYVPLPVIGVPYMDIIVLWLACATSGDCV